MPVHSWLKRQHFSCLLHVHLFFDYEILFTSCMEQQTQINNQKFASIIETDAYKEFWMTVGIALILMLAICYESALSYAPFAVLFWVVPIISTIFLAFRPYKYLGFRDYASVVCVALSAPFIAGYFSAINTYVKELHTSSNYFDTDFGTAKVVFDNYFSNRIVLDYLRHSLPIVVGSLLVAAIIYFFVRRYTLARVLRSVGLDESKLSLSTDSNFDDPFVNPTSVDSPSEDSSDVEMYDTETSLVRSVLLQKIATTSLS